MACAACGTTIRFFLRPRAKIVTSPKASLLSCPGDLSDYHSKYKQRTRRSSAVILLYLLLIRFLRETESTASLTLGCQGLLSSGDHPPYHMSSHSTTFSRRDVTPIA